MVLNDLVYFGFSYLVFFSKLISRLLHYFEYFACRQDVILPGPLQCNQVYENIIVDAVSINQLN